MGSFPQVHVILRTTNVAKMLWRWCTQLFI